jgi:putative tryptophan/tyrosine transport system substrate-binding protein
MVLAGLLAATTTGRARAQQSSKVYRVALIYTSFPVAEAIREESKKGSLSWEFFEELRRLGYVLGQNLVAARYSGAGTENFAELARNVVSSNPDLIFADTSRLVLAFKAATTTIPIGVKRVNDGQDGERDLGVGRV